MRIYIINGPNLQNIGEREPDIYGKKSFDYYLYQLRKLYPDHEIFYFQSHTEGEIVGKIHSLVHEKIDASIINAGAYSHYSVALRDAISSVNIPFVNVHISNIYQREKFRYEDIIAQVCCGTISGLGLKSYKLAIEYLIDR